MTEQPVRFGQDARVLWHQQHDTGDPFATITRRKAVFLTGLWYRHIEAATLRL